jgi:hypothetical protein
MSISGGILFMRVLVTVLSVVVDLPLGLPIKMHIVSNFWIKEEYIRNKLNMNMI